MQDPIYCHFHRVFKKGRICRDVVVRLIFLPSSQLAPGTVVKFQDSRQDNARLPPSSAKSTFDLLGRMFLQRGRCPQRRHASRKRPPAGFQGIMLDREGREEAICPLGFFGQLPFAAPAGWEKLSRPRNPPLARLTRCSLSPSSQCLQPRFRFSPRCSHTS